MSFFKIHTSLRHSLPLLAHHLYTQLHEQLHFRYLKYFIQIILHKCKIIVTAVEYIKIISPMKTLYIFISTRAIIYNFKQIVVCITVKNSELTLHNV